MTYTEIKTRNGKKYYYRVLSLREGSNVKKKRIYLGRDLSEQLLTEKESTADDTLIPQKKHKLLQPLIRKIKFILRKYGVRKAGIFGSYARGEQKKKSDIDILIEPPKGMGLSFVRLALELEERLGKKVDLVTYNGIHPLLKDKILHEEVPLYG